MSESPLRRLTQEPMNNLKFMTGMVKGAEPYLSNTVLFSLKTFDGQRVEFAQPRVLARLRGGRLGNAIGGHRHSELSPSPWTRQLWNGVSGICEDASHSGSLLLYRAKHHSSCHQGIYISAFFL